MFRPHTATRCSPLAALLLAAAAFAAEPPFTGVVARDTRALAGAGDTYYPVGDLHSGDKVEVRQLLYDWYEIDAPAGFFSYISKEYVKLDPDGKTGVVTGDRVRVRAPAPEGAGASYKFQVRLDKAQSVTVLGDAGEFYKIASPPGVRVYVSKDVIRPATAADNAPKAAAPPATPAKPPASAKPSAVTKVGPETPATEPVPPAVEVPKPRKTPAAPVATEPKAEPKPDPGDKTAPLTISLDAEGNATINGESHEIDELDKPVSKALVDNPDVKVIIRSEKQTPYESVTSAIQKVKDAGVTDVEVAAIEPVKPGVAAEAAADAPPARRQGPVLDELERRFVELSKKPLLDQPIAELRVDYEKLLASESLSPTDRALAKARLDMLDHRRDLQARLSDVKAFRQQLDNSRKEREEAEKLKPKRYAAVGRLQASTIYTGEKLPLLYRVYDPTNGLTVAYIQPPSRAEDEYAAMVGQYVGVTGDKDYDPSLKLDVVRAKEIDVLTPKQ